MIHKYEKSNCLYFGSCKRESEGDYQIIVGPLDDSASPVTFKYALSVNEPYAKRYAQSAPAIDNSAGLANSQEQSNTAPKTQYELQLQQAAE